MPLTNIHLYPSTFLFESRILKETKSLVDSNLVDQIAIIAIWSEGLDEFQSIDKKRFVWRVRLRTRWLGSGNIFKIIQFLEWMWVIYRRYRKHPIAVINCHSLSVLPLGVMFKVFLGTKLVYDTHELETETCNSRGLRKAMAKIVERLGVRYADHVIVVSESIAQWYRKQYVGVKCTVVRNIPLKSDETDERQVPLKEKLGINKDAILFIYQGVIDRYRGIELLLAVFSNMGQNKHIVFLGYGDYESDVKACAERSKNIHFHPAVPPHDLMAYTRAADVGISLIENACLSYYYCLPNKVFEYMLGGIPMIVSDFPEMGNFIKEHRCGWTVNVAADAVSDLIASIDQEAIQEKKQGVKENADKLDWRIEERKMLAIYNNLI